MKFRDLLWAVVFVVGGNLPVSSERDEWLDAYREHWMRHHGIESHREAMEYLDHANRSR